MLKPSGPLFLVWVSLAGVALTRGTLPWERSAGGGAPWLAVLLFDDEQPPSPRTVTELVPSGTPIKLAHFTELLDAINAVQPGTNLSWSIPAPTGGGAVLLAHINALRLPLGLPAVDAGSVIRAAHIDDVRLRIRALE